MRLISVAGTRSFSAAWLSVAVSHSSICNYGIHLTAAFSSSHQQRCRALPTSVLRPSQQHPLLPLPNNAPAVNTDTNDAKTNNIVTSTSYIQNAFIDANIDKVAFIRHGNTAPSQVDFDRRLTELGRSQSRVAGASFGIQKLYPYYEKVALCSSAIRCVETAELFMDSSLKSLLEDEYNHNPHNDSTLLMPQLQLHSQLYDGTMQPEGSRLFRSIGYAPLREYLENPSDDDSKTAQHVLGEYGRVALDTIWNVVVDNPHDEKTMSKTESGCKGKTLLFFAHAIYLPSAALSLATAIGCGSKCTDLILDTNTKEAEGYCVHIDKQTISLLHRSENQIVESVP